MSDSDPCLVDRQSPKRFDVELFIVHPTLSPAEITNVLGLVPESCHAAGEPRRTPKRQLPGTYPDTRWRYSSRYEVEDQWFSNAIEELVGRLAPHREFLEHVRRTGGAATLILQFLGDGYHGDTISQATLASMVELGLDFGIECFVDPQGN